MSRRAPTKPTKARWILPYSDVNVLNWEMTFPIYQRLKAVSCNQSLAAASRRSTTICFLLPSLCSQTAHFTQFIQCTQVTAWNCDHTNYLMLLNFYGLCSFPQRFALQCVYIIQLKELKKNIHSPSSLVCLLAYLWTWWTWCTKIEREIFN